MGSEFAAAQERDGCPPELRPTNPPAFAATRTGSSNIPGIKTTRYRLISGTTVSLLDRVATGTFSARLFYRLNIIHVRAGAGRLKSRSLKRSVEMHLKEVSPATRPL